MMIHSNRLTKIGSVALLVVCCLLFNSCTKENLEDCNILYVNFLHTINTDNVDKFKSEVNKVSLFVFDEAGFFVGEYDTEGATLKNTCQMPLRLNPGNYDLYAWGNNDESHQITPLTVGVSTYEDAKLSVVRTEDGTINNACSPLFHGNAQRVTVQQKRSNNATIDMMKNVNSISVTVKGLKTDNIATKAEEEFMCRIISANGDYNFNNSLVGNNPLTYIPQYSVQSNEVNSVFSTLRLFVGDQAHLVITYKSEEIYNENLSELLLKSPDINNQQDLDKIDDYSIVITLDGNTNMATSISINGWTSSNGGTIL